MILRTAMVVAAGLVASCANVECSFNSDCGDRARCELNRCVRDCVQDRDCPGGAMCDPNGACVARDDDAADRPEPKDAAQHEDVPTPPTDAGMDVGFETSVDVGADLGFDTEPEVGLDVVFDRSIDAFVDNGPPELDAPVTPDVPPRDVPPIDAGVPDVRPADVAPTDVPSGPVGVGVYEYTAVRPDALVAPVAVAWHSSGAYALILSSTSTVFRYDVVARTVTRVASTASDVSWRGLAFAPDGSRAVLLANTGSGTARHGRIFVWDHATMTLAERAADAWTMGTYEAVHWSPDGRRAALLGAANAYLSIWWVGADGARTGGPIAYGRVPMTACNDLAWVTDGFGDPALAVVCGTSTAEILSVTNLDATAHFATAASAGSVGNTSRIAARPQGDVALAVGWSAQRLWHYRDAHWDAAFSSPSVIGAFGVAFSTDGARALAFGGFGRAYEYRYDLYSSSEVTEVSIAGLGAAPFVQPSGAALNDVAWRPGCDEGLAVGGASSFSGTSAFVAYFRVTNGRHCP